MIQRRSGGGTTTCMSSRWATPGSVPDEDHNPEYDFGPPTIDEARVRLDSGRRRGSKLDHTLRPPVTTGATGSWSRRCWRRTMARRSRCRRCVDGRRACPPEDCGALGLRGAAGHLRRPLPSRARGAPEWLGRPFDPRCLRGRRLRDQPPQPAARRRRRLARPSGWRRRCVRAASPCRGWMGTRQSLVVDTATASSQAPGRREYWRSVGAPQCSSFVAHVEPAPASSAWPHGSVAQLVEPDLLGCLGPCRGETLSAWGVPPPPCAAENLVRAIRSVPPPSAVTRRHRPNMIFHHRASQYSWRGTAALNPALPLIGINGIVIPYLLFIN